MTVTIAFTLDFDLLTTRAMCDEATGELAFETKTFTTRDANIELADERADRSQNSAAAALTRKDGEIQSVQSQLTATGLAPEMQQDLTDKLELLQAQRKQLVKRGRQTAGVGRFLAAVNAVQVDGQVEVLQAILAAIAAHRATLSA